MKRDPLISSADCKAACTDNASDPPTRSVIRSSASNAHSNHDDGEVISMLHRSLYSVHRRSETVDRVYQIFPAPHSILLSIMPPVLQRSVTLAVRILFGLLLLREMAFVVLLWSEYYNPFGIMNRHHHAYRNDFSHMCNVICIILPGVLVRVPLQYVYNLTTAIAGMRNKSGWDQAGMDPRPHLSWPIVSPDPSSLLHPDP